MDWIGAQLDGFFSLGKLDLPTEKSPAEDQSLLVEIDAALASGSYYSRFSNVIEARFQYATARPRGLLFVRTAIAGTLVYNLFLLVDMVVIPDIMWLAIPLQLGIVTPIIVVFIVRIARNGVDSKMPSIFCLLVMLAGTIALFMISRSPHVGLFAGTFCLFLMSGTVGLSMGFALAVSFSAICLATVSAAVLLHPSLDSVERIFSIALLFATANYSLAGSYRIEGGMRSAYLLALRESLRAGLLDVSNQQLKTLVDVDGLTGIGNRRYLDDRMDALWHDGSTGQKLGFLLIDIDHFKMFNDQHGHQMGDKCLRTVAEALAAETRGGAATLARYGGEEFAVVLESAAPDDTQILAEHLRRSVEKLMVPLDTGETLSVTISIGCAVVTPSSSMGPADLIAAADAALYQAKRQGRNRVETADLKSLGLVHGTEHDISISPPALDRRHHGALNA